MGRAGTSGSVSGSVWLGRKVCGQQEGGAWEGRRDQSGALNAKPMTLALSCRLGHHRRSQGNPAHSHGVCLAGKGTEPWGVRWGGEGPLGVRGVRRPGGVTADRASFPGLPSGHLLGAQVEARGNPGEEARRSAAAGSCPEAGRSVCTRGYSRENTMPGPVGTAPHSL